MKRLTLMAVCAALVVLVQLDTSGTHLLPVLLGMALTTGAVLVVAAAELSNAQWIAPVKRPLLAAAPLLFVFPFLVRLASYPWLAHETRWLRPDFFLARNAGALLVLALIGNLYRRASLTESPAKRKWAVGYLLTFVVAKTMVAMDWVMSFDYPWISTMFPVLYMVECFDAGLALIGLICFVRRQTENVLYDAATLLFGFALFWGGLTFAQYLTIWYANLPEEVHYFTLRFGLMGGREFFAGAVALLFVVPFSVLLIHRARKNHNVIFVLAHLVLFGLVYQRTYHLLPYVNLQLDWLLAESFAMFGALALCIRPDLGQTDRGV